MNVVKAIHCARWNTRTTGDTVIERIVINKESCSIKVNKCDALGRPGHVERTLVIYMRLRPELHERSARSGLHVDRQVPCSITDVIESETSDDVG